MCAIYWISLNKKAGVDGLTCDGKKTSLLPLKRDSTISLEISFNGLILYFRYRSQVNMRSGCPTDHYQELQNTSLLKNQHIKIQILPSSDPYTTVMTDKENLNKSCSSGCYVLYVISRNTDTRYNTEVSHQLSILFFFHIVKGIWGSSLKL